MALAAMSTAFSVRSNQFNKSLPQLASLTADQSKVILCNLHFLPHKQTQTHKQTVKKERNSLAANVLVGQTVSTIHLSSKGLLLTQWQALTNFNYCLNESFFVYYNDSSMVFICKYAKLTYPFLLKCLLYSNNTKILR